MRRRVRHAVAPAGRRLRVSAAACLATLVLACAHAPQTPARAAPAPSPDARELASCGGAGPDSLVLTLSRIPDEEELRRAICDWFSDEPWHVRLRSVGSELPR